MPKSGPRQKRLFSSKNSLSRAKLRAAVEPLETRLLFTGTWTTLAHNAPGAVGTMMLLPDGSVLAMTDGAGPGSDWARLTPVNGSYVNGTWTKLANANDTRLYDTSVVLQNGSVFVAGGEYGTGAKTAETYNPLTNTWTRLPTQNFGSFIDSYGTLLPNGNVLIMPVAPSSSGFTTIYNPTTNTWSQGPKLAHGGSADEQSWVKLADGSILAPGGSQTSQRYIPATNSFVSDGTVPVVLSDSLGEYGPEFLLDNGNAIIFGASGHTAIYTPSGTSSPGSWVAGPDIPGGLGEDDASGVQLHDGNILITAGPVDSYNGPTTLFLYDPIANTFSPFTGPNSYSGAPFVTRMLALPNGDILYSENGSTVYQYDPGTAPLADSVPTITSLVRNSDGTMTLTGTGLNGINVGANYGDDAQMDTNFPVIRFTSGSNTYYARSYNWTNTGVQLGSTPESVTFTLPLGIPAGTYNVVTTANGVASAPTSLTISTTAGNIAPTIATAAASNPTSPSGTTATLSVLGADDAGESNLTYTWTNLTAPSGASLASFSINGSNAAKTTTVTFHKVGTYTFVANVTDSGGLFVNSNTVTVTVTGTLTSITVTPSPVNLTTGQTRQLTATGLDQFGNSLTSQPTFTWALASGAGSVNSSGLYTTPAAGTLATVTATSGAIQGSTTIGVVKSPWTSADLGGPTLGGIAYDTGTTTVEQASGSDIWSTADEFHFDYQTLSGNSAIVTKINSLPIIDTDSTQSSNAKAGIMFRDSTAAGASFVDLVYDNSQGLQFTYRNGTGIAAAQQGSNVAVSGSVYLRLVRSGTTYTASYSTNGTTWTLIGSYTNASIGTSALVGLATCSHDNTKLANVTYSSVAISQPTIATAASVSPNPVLGKTANLSVLGANIPNSAGEASLTYSWAATVLPGGASSPTFSANNTNAAKNTVATFSSPGTYTFVVTVSDSNGQSVTSTVQATVNATLTTVTTAPSSVAGGATSQASAFDQFGKPFTGAINWSVDGGGTISNTGLFTAGQTPGTFTITGSSGVSTQTTTVTVISNAYSGAAGADTYAIRLSPSDPTMEQIFVNTSESNAPTYTFPISQLPSLTFSPTGGDGSLTIDFANGNPLPAGGVSYTGGSNPTPTGNALYIAGSPNGLLGFIVGGSTVTYRKALGSPISYSSLQKIEFDLIGGDNALTQTAQPGAPVVFNAGVGSNTLIVKAGTFSLPVDAQSTSGDLTVNVGASGQPASVLFNASQHLAGLTVGDSGLASAGGASVVTLAGPLALTGTGTLDLGRGQLVADSTATPTSTLLPYIQSAYDNGLWDGPGITSSAIAANPHTAIGYVDGTGANDAPVGSELLAWALQGDTSLKGSVGLDDYNNLAANFNKPGNWSQGDFDYNGTIDLADYNALATNFNATLPPAAAPVNAAPAASTTSAPSTTKATATVLQASPTPAATTLTPAPVQSPSASPVATPSLSRWRRIFRARKAAPATAKLTTNASKDLRAP